MTGPTMRARGCGAEGPPRAARPRAGNTLVEVMVALVVLTVGLTSVIALFPVGMNRVRTSVLDTRTTLMAREAKNNFLLKRMHNDPALINWTAHDAVYLPSLISNNGDENAAAATAAPVLDGYIDASLVIYNLYSWLPFSPVLYGVGNPLQPSLPANWGFYLSAEADRVPVDPNLPVGPNTDDGVVTNASPGYDLSYPILLDPWLFDYMAFSLGMLANLPAGAPRINISTPLTVGAAPPGFQAFNGYYNLVAGAAFPYCDVTVASLYEIAGFPVAPPYAPVADFERNRLKTRWFTSLSDVVFYADRPGQVANPSARDYASGGVPPLAGIHYFEPMPYNVGANPSLLADPNPRATAERNYEYSWAAMIQRRLSPDVRDDVVDPNTGVVTNPGGPEVGRPNPRSRQFSGKLAVLCFYKRNLNSPYAVIEGCFYTGSRKVTLSWPATLGLNVPDVKYGLWLCELSVARDTRPALGAPFGNGSSDSIGSCNRHSGVYTRMDKTIDTDADGLADTAVVKRHYRRAFAFYKVENVVSPPVTVLVGGAPRTFVEVMVDRPARGYPLRYQDPALADSRPIDDYRIPAWPIYDRLDPTLALNPTGNPSILSPQFDDETDASQAQIGAGAQYYPVVIFDGLQEVFEYEF